MHNNILPLTTKYRTIASMWCAVLMSSTGLAQAQVSPTFPEVPKLSPSNAAPVLDRMTQPNLNPTVGNNVAAKTASRQTANTAISSKPILSNARPPSYGTWPKSLMFPEKEIQFMKKILNEYEATGELPLELQDLPEVNSIIPPNIGAYGLMMLKSQAVIIILMN